jgi:hypothetical protein
MAERYAFTERLDRAGRSIILPYIPLLLSLGNRSIEVIALLDSGASVNVIPYEVGLALGAVWENQTLSIPLSGNLAQSDSRGIAISAKVAQFPPVTLGFAGSELRGMSVILGHMNFFREFDVCFYSSRLEFEVRPQENLPTAFLSQP